MHEWVSPFEPYLSRNMSDLSDEHGVGKPTLLAIQRAIQRLNPTFGGDATAVSLRIRCVAAVVHGTTGDACTITTWVMAGYPGSKDTPMYVIHAAPHRRPIGFFRLMREACM